MVQSGDYIVYFNDYTFPQNLEMPEPIQVTVFFEGNNQQEILFELKSRHMFNI